MEAREDAKTAEACNLRDERGVPKVDDDDDDGCLAREGVRGGLTAALATAAVATSVGSADILLFNLDLVGVEAREAGYGLDSC